MASEHILIILSSLVIFSYAFDLIARKTRFPSVLLLLATGIGLAYLARWTGFSFRFLNDLLPLLGTVGLILIVLEGALELKLTREKWPLIKQSLSAAFLILLFTMVVIATGFYLLTEQAYRTCLLNAVPFSIISSAIAIPSASVLPQARREFVTYESSFSDIFGIVVFNFLLSNSTLGFSSFVNLAGEAVVIVILTVAFSLLLLYLLGRITHHLKFFLLIAMLIFIYAIGKSFHLPTLVVVLAFGLFLNNCQDIRHPLFRRFLMYDKFKSDLEQMHLLSGESAFIVRTFFFLLFGFSIQVTNLFSMKVFIWSSGITVIIFLVRYVYQRIVQKKVSLTELLLSPRGLISILLFLSIPEDLKLEGLNNSVLLAVIIFTALLMSLGLLKAKDQPNTEAASTMAETH
ncbi:MAG: sodium:proton antiporter [Bacteroidota bacterium]